MVGAEKSRRKLHGAMEDEGASFDIEPAERGHLLFFILVYGFRNEPTHG